MHFSFSLNIISLNEINWELSHIRVRQHQCTHAWVYFSSGGHISPNSALGALKRTWVHGGRCTPCVDFALRGFPSEIYDIKWDVIMIHGGRSDGRWGITTRRRGGWRRLYTVAGMIAQYRDEGETDVFVHHVNRVVEYTFSKAILRKGYIKKQPNRWGG